MSRLRVLATSAALVLPACGGSPAPTGQGVPAFAGAPSQNPCEIDVDFGNIPIGLTSSVSLDVQNLDGGVLDLTALSGGLDPEFAADASMLSPIGPGNAGAMALTFQPYKVGQVQSSFTIETSGFNPACPASAGSPSALTVQVTGNGIQLSLVVKPNVVDLGDTLVGATATQTVTLDNKSPVPVTGIIAMFDGPDAKLFTASGVPSTLEGYQSAQVTITYAPTSLETRSLATVIFEGSDGEKATLNLFGEPIGCAITLAPNPPDFGFVAAGTTGSACLTLGNVCPFSIIVSAVEFSNPDDPIGVSTQIPLLVPASGSARLCFSYMPTTSGSAPTETATLVLDGGAGYNPVIDL